MVLHLVQDDRVVPTSQSSVDEALRRLLLEMLQFVSMQTCQSHVAILLLEQLLLDFTPIVYVSLLLGFFFVDLVDGLAHGWLGTL